MSRALITERAVMAEGPDSAVPAHYGAPLREQRALMNGRAIVDLGQLEILEVSGPDREEWLTTITSQIFTERRPAESFEATVLSPQGRLEHWAQVITMDDSFLFIVDPGARAPLRAYLELMTFARRITLEDRDDVRVLGSTVMVDTLIADLPILATWKQAWPKVAPGGIAYGPDPQFTHDWLLTLVRHSDARAAVAQGSITRAIMAGVHAAEAIRVANHRPRFSTEVDQVSIPHELDLLRTAIHTNKGCYRGQETVAKVLNLGQPPRRLTLLHLDGSQDLPVPAGAEVVLVRDSGERKVGHISTSVLHADEGPIALALLKRAVPLDAGLTVTFTIPDHAHDTQEPQVIRVDATQEPIVVPREHAPRPVTSHVAMRAPGAKPR